MLTPTPSLPPLPTGSPLEVFLAFLKLGLTSFGGPIAHLGYFRNEFVERRRWVTDAAYSDLVALCQVLPGPTSSQVGFALGLRRAGALGGLAAWLGFTAPSAVLMILFAIGIQQWAWLADGGVVHGLKIAAVAVVAQAVWGMGRTLCPDGPRAAVAVVAAVVALALPSAAGQMLALALGAAAGLWCLAAPGTGVPQAAGTPVGRPVAAACLVLFVVLLVGFSAAAHGTSSPLWGAVAVCYRASAMVFGGGHVVLPLLEAGLVPQGWVGAEQFLAGYGAAQAVPGPLFTFAGYLGAVMGLGGSPWAGGLLLVGVIFLPALLLVVGVLPFWQQLGTHRRVRRALTGVNAAVVGLLGAALYSPLGTGAIRGVGDVLLAAGAAALLIRGRVAPVVVVGLCAGVGWVSRSLLIV